MDCGKISRITCTHLNTEKQKSHKHCHKISEESRAEYNMAGDSRCTPSVPEWMSAHWLRKAFIAFVWLPFSIWQAHSRMGKMGNVSASRANYRPAGLCDWRNQCVCPSRVVMSVTFCVAMIAAQWPWTLQVGGSKPPRGVDFPAPICFFSPVRQCASPACFKYTHVTIFCTSMFI